MLSTRRPGCAPTASVSRAVVGRGLLAAGAGLLCLARAWAAPLPSKLIVDAARAGHRTVAVGEQGAWYSEDGQDWRRGAGTERAMLNAVVFQGPEAGWAVGHKGVILKTVNGGANWRVMRAPEKSRTPLFDVWFADSSHGIAVGAYGAYLSTKDGGVTWASKKLPSGDMHLYAAASFQGLWVLAGESGTLLYSDNRGETWKAQRSGTSVSLFGLAPLPNGEILAYGFKGTVCRSEGKGARWRSVKTGSAQNLMGSAVLEDKVVLVGSEGTVLMTRDGRRFTDAGAQGEGDLTAALPAADGGITLFGKEGQRSLPAANLR